jgi:hypothetical protein
MEFAALTTTSGKIEPQDGDGSLEHLGDGRLTHPGDGRLTHPGDGSLTHPGDGSLPFKGSSLLTNTVVVTIKKRSRDQRRLVSYEVLPPLTICRIAWELRCVNEGSVAHHQPEL